MFQKRSGIARAVAGLTAAVLLAAACSGSASPSPSTGGGTSPAASTGAIHTLADRPILHSVEPLWRSSAPTA